MLGLRIIISWRGERRKVLRIIKGRVLIGIGDGLDISSKRGKSYKCDFCICDCIFEKMEVL